MEKFNTMTRSLHNLRTGIYKCNNRNMYLYGKKIYVINLSKTPLRGKVKCDDCGQDALFVITSVKKSKPRQDNSCRDYVLRWCGMRGIGG